jgi:FkbM family methyltransferase
LFPPEFFMTLQPEVVGEKLTATSLGRLTYQAAKPFVRFVRHLAHPDLPNEHMRTTVSHRGKQFDIRHRRWSQADPLAIQQCFAQAQYDMPDGPHGALLKSIYQKIVASGRKPLIVDCGANIGASVLWFSAQYPEAHIIGIEPAPENFDLLRLNCAGLDVDLRQAGIGAADGNSILSGLDGSHMSYRTGISEDGLAIDVISVKTLLASKPSSIYVPFLLKIDIEGAEKFLFDGDTSALNHFPLIILEPHDWLLPGEGTSLSFFRFHAAAGREFCMKHENIASIAIDPALLSTFGKSGHAAAAQQPA